MKPLRIIPVWRLNTLKRWLTGHAPADEAQLIHWDRDLAVARSPGNSKRLVPVFISIRREALHPEVLESYAVDSDNGLNHMLFINDRERRWYSAPGQRDRISGNANRIIAAADCQDHVVTDARFDDDILHMGHQQKTLPDTPKVRIVVVPGQNNYLARWLKNNGQLARLVAALWAGDRHAREDCSRALPQPLDLSLA